MAGEDDALKVLFLEKAKQWAIEKKEESDRLQAELVLWGAAVPFEGILWDAIKSQILFKAEKMDISPEEVIEHLFEQEDTETWMLAFQLPTG